MEAVNYGQSVVYHKWRTGLDKGGKNREHGRSKSGEIRNVHGAEQQKDVWKNACQCAATRPRLGTHSLLSMHAARVHAADVTR
jgi:hypothetical protein